MLFYAATQRTISMFVLGDTTKRLVFMPCIIVIPQAEISCGYPPRGEGKADGQW